MRLFTVSETIVPGFDVVVPEGGRPYVPLLPYDDEVGGPTCLALGGTICRELQHPDDVGLKFDLLWGRYISQTAGEMLVAKRADEPPAAQDNYAVVRVYRGYLPKVGITRLESADKYTSPDHITHSKGDGVRCDLFLMKPGTGLYIKWDKRLIGARHHLKFIISWDAERQELLREEVGEKPKHWQASHLVEESTTRPEQWALTP